MSQPDRRLLLISLPAAILGLLAMYPRPLAARAQETSPSSERQAIVLYVPEVSFERLMAVPEVEALSRAGGSALLSSSDPVESIVRRATPGSKTTPPPCSCSRLPTAAFVRMPSSFPQTLGSELRRLIGLIDADEALVLVVGSGRSAAMVRAKDELLPVVMAEGDPSALLESQRSQQALSSDSTRRPGVIDGEDVAVTLLEFLGRPVPEDLAGAVIRVVDTPGPFELHERYLAMRRMTVPIQTVAGLYATVVGLLGIALMVLRGRVSARLARTGAWAAMSVPALAVGLLAAGHLPTLSYGTVVPFVVAVTVAGTLAFAPLGKRDVLLPPAGIGWAALAFFVVEAALGWRAALTPFLGGSALDGGRFYGLPNVFIGLLVGASLYAASRLPTAWGFALIAGTALFAGLPFAGSNLGGAITLFVAAGLWLSARSRGRLDWKGVLIAAAVVLAGTALVLLSHQFLTSAPTHVTHFEQTSGRSWSGIWHTFTDRLAVGWRLILRNPFALVPVIGVPATLYAVLRPTGPVRTAFAEHAAWRDAILVALLAGLAAYVANDSGPAALGLAFGLGFGGLLYVSLIERPATPA
ncbi:MAG: hypothetical protein AB1551_04855 [Actinomycetota bacterium]